MRPTDAPVRGTTPRPANDPEAPADGPPPPAGDAPGHGGVPSGPGGRGDRTVRWLRLLVPAVALAVLGVALHRIEPAAPGAFYDAPTPLPPGPPGTLVRHEEVIPAPPGARAWRILYVSTGDDGTATAVSGMVFAPAGPAPDAGRPVVAWAHPTTGVAPRCAPSLSPGGAADRVPGLSPLLDAGFVVAATDYPGLGTPGPHPYLVGGSEARAVLDSIRAARALPAAGAAAEGPSAVWGHSQGGHAALFAGELAPSYAPDVDLAAVAAAAPATDLTALLQHDLGSVAGNVLASMAFVTWTEVYADRGVRLDQVLEPLAVPIARRIAERCVESRTQVAVDLPDAEILRLRFLEAPPWTVEGWDGLLIDNTPGAGPDTIAAPVLVSQGTADTVVWRDVTAAWAAGQCARGVDVTVTEYDGAGHLDIAGRAAGDAVRWVADRLAGRPRTDPSCAG